jgi:drug/metabolite transporter (DMT)-like permease
LLAPFAFTEIIGAVALGWWFWGDLPDRWTIVGVSVLIASAIYISMRERQLARQSPESPPLPLAEKTPFEA